MKCYLLTKKGQETRGRVLFLAVEVEGLLINGEGYPILLQEEVHEVGFRTEDAHVPFALLPDALKPLVLRVGDNRGHLVEERLTVWQMRDKQNEFLKSHGYRWEKRERTDGIYDEFDKDHNLRWNLIGPDGEVVVGQLQSVRAILEKLGYEGEM